MTISSTVSRWEYIGDNSTTEFAYNNKVFEASDLEVYVDGTQVVTGFSVTGVGDEGGGEVVFDAAPDTDAEVTIIRAVPQTQGSDFPPAGPFPAVTVEDAVDRNTVLAQQLKEQLDRVIRYNRTDQNAPSGELPSISELANKFLSFDENGAPVATAEVDLEGQTTSDNITITGDWTFRDVIRLESESGDDDAEVPEFKTARTKTAAVAQRLGAWRFLGKDDLANEVEYAKIRAKTTDVTGGAHEGETFLDVAVAGTLMQGLHMRAANGTGVEIVGLPFLVTNFGAVGDGSTDDTTAIQNAIDAAEAASGGIVFFPQGQYKITSTLTIDSPGVHLVGMGASLADAQGSVLIVETGANDGIHIDNGDFCSIERLRLSGSSLTGGNVITINNTSNQCVVDECRIVNFWNGIEVHETNTIVIRRTQLANASGDYAIKWHGSVTTKSDVLTLEHVGINLGSANDSADGILWDNYADTLRITNSHVLNGDRGLVMRDTAATGSSLPRFLFASNIEIENSNRQCALFARGVVVLLVECYFNNSESSNNVQFDSTFSGNVSMVGCYVRGAEQDGVNINCDNVHLAGCQVGNSSQEGSAMHDNIAIGASADGVTIVGGLAGVFPDSGSNLAAHGVAGAGSNIAVVGVDLSGNVTAGASGVSTNGRIEACPGFVTENWGTEAVEPDANGEATIAHGLDSTPSFASVNLIGDVAHEAELVSLGASDITVRIRNSTDNADVTTGTFEVAWEARV